MLGKKPVVKSSAFADRVRRISEAAPVVPKELANTGVNKREVRKPSFRPGTLTFMHGEKLSVMVTNISATGARVQFVRGAHLPERVLVSEPLTGLHKWGYVVWQAANVAGVEFVGARRKRA